MQGHFSLTRIAWTSGELPGCSRRECCALRRHLCMPCCRQQAGTSLPAWPKAPRAGWTSGSQKLNTSNSAVRVSQQPFPDCARRVTLCPEIVLRQKQRRDLRRNVQRPCRAYAERINEEEATNQTREVKGGPRFPCDRARATRHVHSVCASLLGWLTFIREVIAVEAKSK
jgi:hypothetical protein